MEIYSFHSALSHLYDFYGIEMQEDEFEEIGLHAWGKIGNKRNRLYSFTGVVCNGELELPCNADIIEAVTSRSVDYQMTDNVSRDNYSRSIAESNIEAEITRTNPFYTRGGFVNYERVGNTLYFKNVLNGPINVLYKGILSDENGLPELNIKEKEAIAIYCAYIYNQKQGMITKDKSMLEIAMLLKAEWLRSCSDARTPEYLNQNDWDNILQANNSWDRKRYNVSYKPIR